MATYLDDLVGAYGALRSDPTQRRRAAELIIQYLELGVGREAEQYERYLVELDNPPVITETVTDSA